MIYKPLISRVLVLPALVAFAFTLKAQDAAPAGDPAAGKTLFIQNCGQCHATDMKTPSIGPALGGVEERWADYPAEDLNKWIRNSQALIGEGHPRAVELWDQYKPVQMNSFLSLTDGEIANILAYVQGVYDGSYPPKTAGDQTGTVTVTEEKPDNRGLFILLALILGLLAVVLARIVANLNYMIQVREGNAPERRKTLFEMLTSKWVIGFIIFALVVFGGYTTVSNAIDLGRQQGYQPEQPIKFSHETHAGIQKIDCQYCHDGARRSKNSIIPAANTCMNCHRAIEVGSTYGTAELTKIFASIGYNPNTDKYEAGYDQMTEEQIKQIYMKWISDEYLKSEKGIARPLDAESIAEEQWAAIVKSLTNEETGDNKIYGPIEWVRIHNLPDHVYFNHAQHVTVGKLQCQSCHGPVETMKDMYQYSPLSMGWCVNCHRQTEVQFTNNEYYKDFQRYHEEIKSGKRSKVTVEEIGGLECQKCHY